MTTPSQTLSFDILYIFLSLDNKLIAKDNSTHNMCISLKLSQRISFHFFN